ncbi:hypothetical protein BDZ45DRAFT_746038 [Acephala macrosclerotiorum]|nr:hypothetical protein BDZ45DRAFT_746038 [Acephala macrosclerotiorum]
MTRGSPITLRTFKSNKKLVKSLAIKAQAGRLYQKELRDRTEEEAARARRKDCKKRLQKGEKITVANARKKQVVKRENKEEKERNNTLYEFSWFAESGDLFIEHYQYARPTIPDFYRERMWPEIKKPETDNDYLRALKNAKILDLLNSPNVEINMPIAREEIAESSESDEVDSEFERALIDNSYFDDETTLVENEDDFEPGFPM